MQIVPIMLIAAVLAADAGVRFSSAPDTAPAVSLAAAMAALPLTALTAWLAVRWALRHLDRHRSIRPLIRAERLLHILPVVVVAGHVTALLVFDWLSAIRGVIGNPVLVDEVLAIVPAMCALLMLRLIEFPLERRIRDALLLRQLDAGEPVYAPPSRRDFVTGALRMQLAFALVPILLIIGFSEAFDRAMAMESVQLPSWAEAAGAWAGVLLVLLIAPLLCEFLLDVHRPGPGSLRSDAEALARRHRIRIGRLLVWRTGGCMMNAAVMGVLPMVRRLLVTDALLEQLRTDEVRAVIAHELGHLRFRHLVWTVAAMVAVLMSAAVAVGGVLTLAQPLMGEGLFLWLEVGGYVIAVAGMLTIFGWVSRRFEQQADAFAVRALTEDPSLTPGPDGRRTAGAGRIDPMIVLLMQETLERVTRLNGGSPERRSWRHGSVRARQRALAALIGAHPQSLPIDRRVRQIKLVVVMLLAASAALQYAVMIFFPAISA